MNVLGSLLPIATTLAALIFAGAWLLFARHSHQVGEIVVVTLAGRARSRLLRLIVPLFAKVTPRLRLASDGVTVTTIPITSAICTGIVTLYVPDDPAGGPWPVHFSYHSGGYATGSPRQDDLICRHLAVTARCAIASVEYPLAPEHRYPSAVIHSLAVMRTLLRHGRSWRLDASRVTVGGFSAGGGLAAVLARRIRDEGAFRLSGQVLAYPWLDLAWTNDPVKEPGMGNALPPSMLPFFRAMYLPRVTDRESADVSPLRCTTLSGLAPACIVTGSLDLINEQSQAYAERLSQAGVSTEYHEFAGADHGFTHSGPLPAAREALALMTAALTRFHCRT
ncbi:hypothetical protein BJI69_18110 [Luteibacter rhizovicinus DSM 16549]|uniref:Alpha/beta hydrolase fold-3 domain-containing protein n=1 Tax=Luteibacter rhizovicinus DSM 16549 TaxID=1440763 RepID=A0A1L3EX44_9GAMM|nr:hypothetical protein BJI69_18110 [Luteibacter rhizovicinus DSM 16549]